MSECSFCGRRAVYNDRTAGVYRCDRCFQEYVEKNFRKTISQYELVESGDKIIAGVSGGTDSISNLYLLKEHCEYKDNELVSLTTDEGMKVIATRV